MTPSYDAATPADLPVLMTLIGELAEFERLAHEVVVTEASLSEALFGAHPAVETVIARVDGEVAGFALFYHNFSTFLGRRGLFLEDLYVRPASAARASARGCWSHVARLAAARGCGRMEWSVLNWNRRAIGFYESLGARPVNDWTVYRLDRAALDAVLAPATGGSVRRGPAGRPACAAPRLLAARRSPAAPAAPRAPLPTATGVDLGALHGRLVRDRPHPDVRSSARRTTRSSTTRAAGRHDRDDLHVQGGRLRRPGEGLPPDRLRPRPASTASTWGMQFVWPFKAEYLIADLDADYRETIIARSARDYVWIMARTPRCPTPTTQRLVAAVAALGYDVGAAAPRAAAVVNGLRLERGPGRG